MNPKIHLVVGIGEVLWDMLPTGKQLGGAPANFAYFAHALGDDCAIVSRVGCDADGREIGERFTTTGVASDYLQFDDEHSTGKVVVETDVAGQPHYNILEDVAWDYLEWSAELERLAARADAVCWGTLAQRSVRTRETIMRFIEATRDDAVRIFDVNLRQSFFSAELLAASIRQANVVKLNHEELPRVLSALGLGNGARTEADQAQELLNYAAGVNVVCITRGERGSLLLSRSERIEHAGLKTRVVDTVGAGDAFTAMLAHGLLRGEPLPHIGERANRIGAWVASHTGATPYLEESSLKQIA